MRSSLFSTRASKKIKSLLLLATAGISLLPSQPLLAGTIWDAGGGANTNIDLNTNWDSDVVNAINGTTAITSFTGGSSMNVNVDASFTSVLLNRAAAFSIDGTSNLILMSLNSSTSQNLTMSSGAGATQTLNAPLQVNTTNTANKFLCIRNNNATAGRILDINSNISRSAGSTADMGIRFDGVAGSVTRIDGTLSNVATIQQSISTAWAGDLIFGGSRTNASTAISIATVGTGTTPATTARLFLGETPTDVQSWGSLVLNNTVKLVVGGNISMTSVSVGGNATAATTRVVGNSATNSTISFTSGTISGLGTFGGTGTNENNLNLTKTGAGTLNITGGTHTFTGATTVNGGTLSISSGVSMASPFVVNGGTLSVAAGETLTTSVTVNAGGTLAGEGGTSGGLTFGAGTSGISFDPTTPGAFTANTVNASGALVVLSPSGATTIGTPYVVLVNSAGFTGSPTTNFVAGSRGTLAFGNVGNTDLILTPTAAASVTWKGNDGTNPTFWDVATTLNWTNGGPDRFYANDAVTFDDSASSFNVAVQGTSVSPGNVVFNNSLANPYTVTGGGIAGSGSITKNGTGAVTIAGAISKTGGLSVTNGTLTLNAATGTMTGGISISGGELAFANINALNPASNNVVLGAGKITYTGSSTITNDAQTFNVTTNGAEISTATTGVNASTLTWRIGGKVSGAGDWTKSGIGVLALGRSNNTNPNNDFTGKVTVTAGTLDIRWGDSLGSTSAGTEVQGATLLIQNFGQTTGTTVTVAEPLTFSGSSYLTSLSQELKNFTNQFNGPITVSGTLGVSTARAGANPQTILELISNTISTNPASTIALGKLAPSYPVAVTTAAQTINISSNIVGSGGVSTEGDAASVFTLSGTNTYSGPTTVNAGTLKITGTHSPVTPGSLAVNNSAVVNVDGGNATFASVNAASGATVTVQNNAKLKIASLAPTPIASANVLSTLNIVTGGQVDITNNAVVLRSTDTSDSARNARWAQVLTGQNSFDNNGQVTWDGPGIVSSSARANNLGLGVDAFAVAVVSNHDLAKLSIDGGAVLPYDSGNPWLGTVTSVGADDILIRMTYAGDTNLDGQITIDDYNNIDGTFSGVLPTNYGWVSGDFDFSGAITIDDYNAIDSGFLYQGGQLTQEMIAARTAMFGSDYVAHLEAVASAFAAVPEPATAGLLALATMGMLSRRRKH